MNRTFITLGAVSAAVAVGLGAFAAHGLEGQVEERALAAFETGAQYQMYHALGLIAVGLFPTHRSRLSTAAGWAFVVGTICFSGGLYAWTLTGVGPLMAVVPLGGISFILGWLFFAFAAVGPRPALPLTSSED